MRTFSVSDVERQNLLGFSGRLWRITSLTVGDNSAIISKVRGSDGETARRVPRRREGAPRLKGAPCGWFAQHRSGARAPNKVSARGRRPLKRPQSKTQGGTVC